VDNSIPFEARFTTTFGGLSNLELPSTKNFHSFLQCNTVLNAMISKAVRFMSTFHGTAHALKRGDMSKMDDVVRSTVFSPQHFPKFLGTTMVFSFFGGFFWMESLKKSRIPAVAASSLRG
jgi:heme/copper-type cytochrome/quinol oxidase subunit 1